MNDKEKETILKVAGSKPQFTLPFIHQIHQGFKRGSEMVAWLAKKGIVGDSFENFVKECGGSKLRMGSYILKRMEQEKTRPIFAKDLL